MCAERVGGKRAWAVRPPVVAAGVGYCAAEAEQCMHAAKQGTLFSALSATPCSRTCTWIPCVKSQTVRCTEHHTVHACLSRCKRRRTVGTDDRSSSIVCSLSGTHLHASEEVDEYAERDRCSTYVAQTRAVRVVRSTGGVRTVVPVPCLTVISSVTSDERYRSILEIVEEYAAQGCAGENPRDSSARARRSAAIACVALQVHSLWTVVARHMVKCAHAQLNTYRLARHCSVMCSYVMTSEVAGPTIPTVRGHAIAETPGEFDAHPFSTTALVQGSSVAQYFSKVKAHAPTLLRMLHHLDDNEMRKHASRVRAAMREYAAITGST